MPPGVMRLLLFTAIVAAGVALAAAFGRPGSDASPARLSWVATAHQMGPVGYRDPVGAISPDGQWIAYSEGRWLRVRRLDGGPVKAVPANRQVRHLAWRPDSRGLIFDGGALPAARGVWRLYDVATESTGPIVEPDATLIAPQSGGSDLTAAEADLRQPSFAPDGSIAAIVATTTGPTLWTIAPDGARATATRLRHPAEFPLWTPAGFACVSRIDGRRRLTVPCDGTAIVPSPDLDLYGPLALSPDGSTVYGGMPNLQGTLDVWSLPIRGGRASRLSSFATDSYAPSVAADGSVVFKVQSYRTNVALSSAHNDRVVALATFRSETPSWHPDGRSLGITYGTWRRVVDDANYPDIAQEAGIIDVDLERPATKVRQVVQASPSEDQALCWSPNGKWIAYHSHKDGSDDIWLRPAATPEGERRVSFLGRGAETGWPRWSRDGKWLLYDGASPTTHRSVMWVAGVDQESGEITSPPREIAVSGLDVEVSHAEWLSDSAQVVAVGRQDRFNHVIYTVPRDGGTARVVHHYVTEHDAPGLGVSPNGAVVAYVAPDRAGYFQIWKVPIEGGTPEQLTIDPSHKTQPAWSPDGKLIAFTVWNYEAQFWRLMGPDRSPVAAGR